MKVKIKKDLTGIVEKSIKDYSDANTEEQSKVLGDLIKEINIIKEIETNDIDNSIKKQKLKIEIEKLEIEKSRLYLENQKFILEENKVNLEESKLDLERIKFELDRTKFESEKSKSKADKIYNSIVKGLEIGVPLVVNTALTLMLFRLIYKDDGRAPSELKDLMRHVYKK